MKSIKLTDINSLYQQCGITDNGGKGLKEELSTGVLNNIINVGRIIKQSEERPFWANTTIETSGGFQQQKRGWTN